MENKKEIVRGRKRKRENEKERQRGDRAKEK